MKADEPENRVRLVKYGLPASEVSAFEAHYSVLMEERQAIGAAVAHQNLQRAIVFLASLGAQPQPMVDEAVAQVPDAPMLPTPSDALPADGAGLRAALGLT
jgi:hypothetical protein